MADVVVLKNESDKNVAYKIKITSPEKFRVRPSTGTIAPGVIEFIRVYLQNGIKFASVIISFENFRDIFEL